MGALAHAERLRSIDRCGDLPTRRQGAWEAGRDASLPTAGFHRPERWRDRSIVWSEPAALIQLPLEPGRYDVVVEWAQLDADPEPRFYLNERAVSARPGDACARMTVSVPEAARARLAWVCRPRRAPTDRRRLGLPLRRISWRPA